MGIEIAFGKGRWMYWTILLAVLVAVVVVVAKRKSPEEIARQRLTWGDEAFKGKDYEQAIAFYKTAINNDPTLWSAYFNLALAYEYVDDGKALAAWEKYLEVAKDEPSQKEWLAQARDHRGRLRAGPHFTRAVDLNEGGDYERAREEYKAALEWSPENLDILRRAAANEAAAGDYAAAAQYYEKALALAPYSINIKYDLGRAYENFDKGKAAALYGEILETYKTNPGITTEKLKDAQRRYVSLRREGYRD
ncbi:MAG: tetratricopeptide repeat protein [candidate division Zixibacteria bacterium]|nr:tetratricopeptide repeat protein [candidate division Zixibacteria bacterium]